MKRDPYSWGDPGRLTGGAKLWRWLLAPFGFIISKTMVGLLSVAAVGGSAGDVYLD